MTKRGIFHNLHETEYATSNNEVAFFFSSITYQYKFMEEYKEYRESFRKRIAKAMNVNEINTSLLADVHFYKEIEKRGFRVTINGREQQWRELHQFALTKMTEKNTLDWHVTQKLK